MKIQAKVMGTLMVLALAGLPALAQAPVSPDEQPPGSVGYDIETGQWLFDTDGDTFPDLTEELGGTDPLDKDSNPLALLGQEPDPSGAVGKVGFTSKACRSGFVAVPGAPFMCISQWVQDAARYAIATTSCRNQNARVCSYEDLGYIYFMTKYDASFNAAGGKWLGDFTQDDYVNCGNFTVTFDNDPNIYNFEGTCNKMESHAYWCCHDRDPFHP